VRVTPQLIRVSDDQHLWAGRFDETLEEVFEVQSRIAEQVATALDLALQRPEQEAIAAKLTEDLRAYDFYLRGNDYFARPGDPESYRMAEQMYTKATELDPGFALAFARLARSHISEFHFSDRTGERLAKARSAADSALRLQPDLPEAHLARGQIHYWGELDYDRALREFRIAHARDPGNSDIAWARGLVERRLGQWELRANRFQQVGYGMGSERFDGVFVISGGEDDRRGQGKIRQRLRHGQSIHLRHADVQ
jgi:serine/threonine-protein kinase